jgi:hypothetical protein
LEKTKMTRRSERRAARRIADRTNETVADGTVIRVPLMMQDAALRDDLRRRHPPATDDATRTAAVVAATEFVVARDAAAADPLAMFKPGFRFGDVAGHVKAVEAYEAGVRELTDAWRAEDSVDVTKAGSAEAQVKPTGAWGLNIGLKAGDVCAFEGGIGRLVRKGDFLFCELDPAPQPRVPSSNPSTDSVGTMDAVTAWKIRSAAYNEMVADLTSAWKSKD